MGCEAGRGCSLVFGSRQPTSLLHIVIIIIIIIRLSHKHTLHTHHTGTQGKGLLLFPSPFFVAWLLLPSGSTRSIHHAARGAASTGALDGGCCPCQGTSLLLAAGHLAVRATGGRPCDPESLFFHLLSARLVLAPRSHPLPTPIPPPLRPLNQPPPLASTAAVLS